MARLNKKIFRKRLVHVWCGLTIDLQSRRFGRTLTFLRRFRAAVRSVGFQWWRLNRSCTGAAIVAAVAGTSRIRLIAKRRPFRFRCVRIVFSHQAIDNRDGSHFGFRRTIFSVGLRPEKRRSRSHWSLLRLRLCRWRRCDFVPERDCSRLRQRLRPFVLLVRLAPQWYNVRRTSHFGRLWV